MAALGKQRPQAIRGGVSLRKKSVFLARTPLENNVDQPRGQLPGWASPGLWHVPQIVVDPSEGLLQEDVDRCLRGPGLAEPQEVAHASIGGLANRGAFVPDPTKNLPLPTAEAQCLIFEKSLARPLPGALRSLGAQSVWIFTDSRSHRRPL